jgi:cytochrome c oxidase subunit 4
MRGPEVDPRRARALPFVIAWIALLVLAGFGILSAFMRIGHWGVIVQFAIAAIQAAVIFILFMRLKGLASLRWVFAFSGFFWLLFLYGLSMTDYSNRRGWPPLLSNTSSRLLHQDGYRQEWNNSQQ